MVFPPPHHGMYLPQHEADDGDNLALQFQVAQEHASMRQPAASLAAGASLGGQPQVVQPPQPIPPHLWRSANAMPANTALQQQQHSYGQQPSYGGFQGSALGGQQLPLQHQTLGQLQHQSLLEPGMSDSWLAAFPSIGGGTSSNNPASNLSDFYYSQRQQQLQATSGLQAASASAASSAQAFQSMLGQQQQQQHAMQQQPFAASFVGGGGGGGYGAAAGSSSAMNTGGGGSGAGWMNSPQQQQQQQQQHYQGGMMSSLLGGASSSSSPMHHHQFGGGGDLHKNTLMMSNELYNMPSASSDTHQQLAAGGGGGMLSANSAYLLQQHHQQQQHHHQQQQPTVSQLQMQLEQQQQLQHHLQLQQQLQAQQQQYVQQRRRSSSSTGSVTGQQQQVALWQQLQQQSEANNFRLLGTSGLPTSIYNPSVNSSVVQTDLSDHHQQDQQQLDQLHQQQQQQRKISKKRAKTFPEKLMQAMMEYGDEDAIGWLPDDKSFVIVSPDVFVREVLNKVFKQAKYASFIRKLHRWGFMRLTSGTGTDCFYHPLFQRNKKDLASKITCAKDGKLGSSTTGPGSQLLARQRNEKPPSLAGVEKFIRAKAAAAASAAASVTAAPVGGMPSSLLSRVGPGPMIQSPLNAAAAAAGQGDDTEIPHSAAGTGGALPRVDEEEEEDHDDEDDQEDEAKDDAATARVSI